MANRPIVLVSAPAGYGKTTLVNLWLESAEQPYVWYSLDENDSNLVRFVAYLVAALRVVYPNAGRNISSVLVSVASAPPDVLAELFVKDLETLDGALVFILDDYHLIHNVEAHTFLAQVVARLPPGVRLVLISRSDPPILTN